MIATLLFALRFVALIGTGPVFVDSIDDGTATILLDPDGSHALTIPATMLPACASEGSWIANGKCVAGPEAWYGHTDRPAHAPLTSDVTL